MKVLAGVLFIAFAAAVALLFVREWDWRCWSADVADDLAELERRREAERERRALGHGRAVHSLVVWIALAALWQLDHHGPHVGQHAAVFAFIINALVWIGEAIAAAGTYIAVTLEVFVQYVWEVLGWLTRRVADVLSNTGAMFSRVWESARQFYDNVLRPALVWLHDFYERIRSWLTKVLKPVLQWAYRVRDELRSLYKRFVRPILDALDTTRKVLDVLTKLHVPFARQLDAYVTRTEQIITENYLRLLSYVNQAIDAINSIITVDGLLQRYLFLGTYFRDAGYTSRMWWYFQTLNGPAKKPAVPFKQTGVAKDPASLGPQLGAAFRSAPGPLTASVTDAAALWRASAGVTQ